jgi:hypothetical protein
LKPPEHESDITQSIAYYWRQAVFNHESRLPGDFPAEDFRHPPLFVRKPRVGVDFPSPLPQFFADEQRIKPLAWTLQRQLVVAVVCLSQEPTVTKKTRVLWSF